MLTQDRAIRAVEMTVTDEVPWLAERWLRDVVVPNAATPLLDDLPCYVLYSVSPAGGWWRHLATREREAIDAVLAEIAANSLARPGTNAVLRVRRRDLWRLPFTLPTEALAGAVIDA